MPHTNSWKTNCSIHAKAEESQLTPATANASALTESPSGVILDEGSPCSVGSPSLQDLLCQQGLWPPPPAIAAADTWSWPASPTRSTGPADSPAEATDPRLREAQRLLAQMLAAPVTRGDGFAQSKRRRASAPLLGSHRYTAVGKSSSSSPAIGGLICNKSPGGGSSSCGPAIRREATTPPLKPINGSMPLFPPPDRDAASQPGLLRGGPRN
jgi:hypothetical protein